MTRLAIAAGPPAALPLAFLAAVPVWGIVTGLLLAVDGDIALASRWAPATLALVHATTLGVLGNAMAGALLQFLPAAAGTRVRGGWRAGAVVFAVLQAGTLALVSGFRASDPDLLTAGAVGVATAFALLAACVLPGLLARREALHGGIAMAVVALMATAALGTVMVLAIAGHLPGLRRPAWVDVHAMWGLLGAVLGLLAAVAQVVLPMFQGVAAQTDARHAVWRAMLLATLVMGTGLLAWEWSRAAAFAVAACCATWALSLLWRQARAGRRRAGWPRAAWSVGGCALLAGSLALAAGAPAILIGTLVLALALPLPVLSMLLEIVAFLCWIDLQRRSPGGRRVPPVQALLTARTRALTLAALGIAGCGVVLATRQPALAAAAGLVLAAAHAMLLLAVLGAVHRGRRHLAAVLPA